MSLLEPIEHIIGTHHAYLRRVLPEILTEIQNAGQSLANEAGKNLHKNFELMRKELDQHMLKEEVMLFPSILEVERAAIAGTTLDLTRHDIKNPLEQMEFEHNVTERFLAEIHAAGEQLEWRKNFKTLYRKVSDLEADLLLHVALEEENLFKAARKLYIQVTSRCSN